MDEQHEEVEGTDQSRREFATKLLAVAGAVAAAGLLGSGDSVDAQGGRKVQTGIHKMPVSEYKLERSSAAVFKFFRSSTGFRITVAGGELGEALQSAGLVAPNASLQNATITIEFTT